MAWRDDGTLDQVHDRLRSGVRKAAGRDIQPTAAVLDSQSVKTTEAGGPQGYDQGKKVTPSKGTFYQYGSPGLLVDLTFRDLARVS